MNWEKWDRIESLMDQYGIRPIVGIVPDNKDPSLDVNPPRVAEFWHRATEWKKKNWVIGIHGFQHVYDSKGAPYLKLQPQSEFAGHPYQIQKKKLFESFSILNNHGIDPDIFIAPGHSFDQNTLKVLKELRMEILSDGFFFRPVIDELGITWVPQQFWRPRLIPFGVWTICYHPGSLTEEDFIDLESFIKAQLEHIKQPFEIILNLARRQTMTDTLVSKILLQFTKLKIWLTHEKKNLIHSA